MSTGSYLTELRRSNASGVHKHEPTRTEANRRAIQLSIGFDADYAEFSTAVDDLSGPTDEEVQKEEESRPHVVDQEEYDNKYEDNDDWPYDSYNTSPEDYESLTDPYDKEYDVP